MSLHLKHGLFERFSSVDITSHKEEMAPRIKYDENDWQVAREKLKTCIDTLNTAGQASTLINIVSGRICPNDQMCMRLWTWAKPRMKLSSQERFHQPLKKRVYTKKESKKKTRTDPAEQFESGLIFEF